MQHISSERGSLLEELSCSIKETMKEEFRKIKLELLSQVNSEINTSFNRYVFVVVYILLRKGILLEIMMKYWTDLVVLQPQLILMRIWIFWKIVLQTLSNPVLALAKIFPQYLLCPQRLASAPRPSPLCQASFLLRKIWSLMLSRFVMMTCEKYFPITYKN